MIDDTNRNTALACALIEELARSGVAHAVASPGSRSSPVTLALDREPGIELRMVLDERDAGFVALGQALATGRPSVVACTSGSAAANLHPAVVEADLAGVPMLVLTSDRPPELRGIGAGQAIDQLKLYGDAVRWFCEVGTHEADDGGLMHYRSLGCRAFAEATQGRGPVHLNLAWRDPLGPDPRPGEVSAADPLAREGRDAGRPLTAGISNREPGEELLEALCEALNRAERPVLVAGRETRTDVAAAVAALAGRLGIPLLAEPTSQLRSGPQVAEAPLVAAYDLIVRDLPQRLAPDLVLRFGDTPTCKPLRALLAAAGAPDQIVIDPPGRWDDPSRRAGALVRAAPESVAAALAERAQPASEPWTEAWRDAERKAQAAIDHALGDGDGLSEPLIARLLGAALRDHDQLLLASSMPVRDAEAFFPPSAAATRVFSNRGANGIDGLAATSAGIAAASGEHTWALLGDLAVAHDVGGLAAIAADGGEAIHLLVVDNGGGRIFEFLPQASQVERRRFERLFITPSGLDLERAARLYGLGYTSVTERAELEQALEERPAGLIHARVDPVANVEIHARLAAAVAKAVAGQA